MHVSSTSGVVHWILTGDIHWTLQRSVQGAPCTGSDSGGPSAEVWCSSTSFGLLEPLHSKQCLVSLQVVSFSIHGTPVCFALLIDLSDWWFCQELKGASCSKSSQTWMNFTWKMTCGSHVVCACGYWTFDFARTHLLQLVSLRRFRRPRRSRSQRWAHRTNGDSLNRKGDFPSNKWEIIKRDGDIHKPRKWVVHCDCLFVNKPTIDNWPRHVITCRKQQSATDRNRSHSFYMPLTSQFSGYEDR